MSFLWEAFTINFVKFGWHQFLFPRIQLLISSHNFTAIHTNWIKGLRPQKHGAFRIKERNERKWHPAPNFWPFIPLSFRLSDLLNNSNYWPFSRIYIYTAHEEGKNEWYFQDDQLENEINKLNYTNY